MTKIKKDLYYKLNKYPKRLLHVLNVASIAQRIAINYQYENLEEVYLAGLLHDYAKYESNDFYNTYIEKEIINKYSNTKVIYHAYAAANYFRQNYNISDNIYLAIYNHVWGRPNMTLIEKFVFVADSIYLNGTNNTRYLFLLALDDIDKAVIEALELTFKSLKERNLQPVKIQVETYNYYKGVTK